MLNDWLVIIDPQYDFVNEKGEYANRHSSILQIKEALLRIESLLTLWDKTKVLIVYAGYKTDQFAEGLSICIPGTQGYQIGLNGHTDIKRFEKPEHSCFTSNAFMDFLEKEKVERLILCGFLAEYCVRQTALDALANNIKVLLVEDCIGTADDVQDRKQKMIEELKEKGAEVAESETLIA